jgi:hypothetical protein
MSILCCASQDVHRSDIVAFGNRILINGVVLPLREEEREALSLEDER